MLFAGSEGFAVERGSGGLFWAGPVVQGPGVDWQYPSSRVDSTPFFLAAQRRTASTVKKKLPKGTPWKGFLWTLPETKGTAVPLAPWGCPTRTYDQSGVVTYF